jgi:hypothetical protein
MLVIRLDILEHHEINLSHADLSACNGTAHGPAQYFLCIGLSHLIPFGIGTFHRIVKSRLPGATAMNTATNTMSGFLSKYDP